VEMSIRVTCGAWIGVGFGVSNRNWFQHPRWATASQHGVPVGARSGHALSFSVVSRVGVSDLEHVGLLLVFVNSEFPQCRLILASVRTDL
jgi:hypothetical protein